MGQVPSPFNLQGFFSFRFLINRHSVGLYILIHKLQRYTHVFMYVYNFLKASISLWYDIIWNETFVKSPQKEVLAFFTLGHLPQVTRRPRAYVTTLGLTGVEISGHKGRLFLVQTSSEDARDPNAEVSMSQRH